MSGFVSVEFWLRVFSFDFRRSDLNCFFFLFPLAISPMRFGRPGDWPVSLKGQGELARAGLQNGRIYCEGGRPTFGFVGVEF
jgi:hypothetical protein